MNEETSYGCCGGDGAGAVEASVGDAIASLTTGEGSDPSFTLDLLRDAIRTLEGEALTKALDPLDPADFDRVVTRLGKALEQAAKPHEVLAAKKALRALSVDWSKLTQAQKEQAFQDAEQAIADSAKKIAPKVERIAGRAGAVIYDETKTSTIDTYSFPISDKLSPFDKEAIAWMKKSQGLFVHDAMGRRGERYSDRAKDIVAEGFAQGLSDKEIAAQLTKQLGLGRSKDYWEVVANVFCQRTKTFSSLSTYQDAGVEYYLWLSIMDEVTSVQCRFMDGRRFPVEASLKVLQESTELSDPAAIADQTPWLQVGKSKNGREVLYYEQGGKKKSVARVVDAEKGSFSSTRSLPANVSMPPVHPRCRSVIVPEV